MTRQDRAPVAGRLTDAERLDWLRLIRSHRVGATTFWRLLAETGSATAALDALPRVASGAGVRDYRPCPERVAIVELRAGAKLGARLLAHADADYPPALRDLPDAPPLVWIRGEPAVLARPMVALVGARNASSLGLRMATAMARDLSAAGWCVVSGLARGIDTASHESALSGMGGTVAVVAGGIDVIYPAENAALAARIAAEGAMLSDQPIGLTPTARNFPARNRLISGLARAVVVIEGAVKSGSLITARAALDQGREVLAVPGHPFDARAGGANLLIRDGATLVRDAEDVLEMIGGAAPIVDARPVRLNAAASAGPIDTARVPSVGAPDETGSLRRRLLDRLGPSPMAEDQLIRDLGSVAQAILPILTDLELDGHITRQPGGLISRLD